MVRQLLNGIARLQSVASFPFEVGESVLLLQVVILPPKSVRGVFFSKSKTPTFFICAAYHAVIQEDAKTQHPDKTRKNLNTFRLKRPFFYFFSRKAPFNACFG